MISFIISKILGHSLGIHFSKKLLLEKNSSREQKAKISSVNWELGGRGKAEEERAGRKESGGKCMALLKTIRCK